MTSSSDRLTIEQITNIAENADYDSTREMARQFLDTLRENERLREENRIWRLESEINAGINSNKDQSMDEKLIKHVADALSSYCMNNYAFTETDEQLCVEAAKAAIKAISSYKESDHVGDANDMIPIAGNASQDPDINVCPGCGGPADNGFDRCLPPSPYYCTKCDSPTQNWVRIDKLEDAPPDSILGWNADGNMQYLPSKTSDDPTEISEN